MNRMLKWLMCLMTIRLNEAWSPGLSPAVLVIPLKVMVVPSQTVMQWRLTLMVPIPAPPCRSKVIESKPRVVTNHPRRQLQPLLARRSQDRIWSNLWVRRSCLRALLQTTTLPAGPLESLFFNTQPSLLRVPKRRNCLWLKGWNPDIFLRLGTGAWWPRRWCHWCWTGGPWEEFCWREYQEAIHPWSQHEMAF